MNISVEDAILVLNKQYNKNFVFSAKNQRFEEKVIHKIGNVYKLAERTCVLVSCENQRAVLITTDNFWRWTSPTNVNCLDNISEDEFLNLTYGYTYELLGVANKVTYQV
jgi:hypothetical protein